MTQSTETKVPNGTVRLGDVIIDPSYQVRKKVNLQKINHYADSMRAGSVFPPIVIEKVTNKVVCGFTTLQAMQKTWEPDTRIPVVIRSFENEGERLRFAAEDNATHGQPLDPFDIKDILARLAPFGITDSELSSTFRMSVGKLNKLAGQNVITVGVNPRFVPEEFDDEKRAALIAEVTQQSTEETEGTTVVEQPLEPRFIKVLKPLKLGMSHLIGQEISVEVYKNMEDHYFPHYNLAIIDQVIMRIDDNTINRNSVNEMAALRVLYTKLGAFLSD